MVAKWWPGLAGASFAQAVLASGGRLEASRSIFERNVATLSGGALHAAGGLVELSNRSLLRGNEAPLGSSMQLTSDELFQYHLPCPLGRWVFAPIGSTSRIGSGSVDADYPFACNAGLVGNSYEVKGVHLYFDYTLSCSGRLYSASGGGVYFW